MPLLWIAAPPAALRRRPGEQPVVIERHPKCPGRGYMLGLSLVDRRIGR
ncbi:hypothetical protein [Blastopirellula marina]|uniref:Uncharacterized protein n=1 Tax=Blastopirellula marina DSM 3645 TaxID=314230 RepID=A3ZRP2_9BACT|nr:hypothetical protein [Blastopirellula marina]EAQ80811.1 hypothetical protein DSM3645_12361 [Blastopirellula marina DSM 3645]